MNSRRRNDQGYLKGQGQVGEYDRCELCNVRIFRNPCCDPRSYDVFAGKGKILCNKCAALIDKMPAVQALQALNNAYETYRKNKNEE